MDSVNNEKGNIILLISSKKRVLTGTGSSLSYMYYRKYNLVPVNISTPPRIEIKQIN